jgi:hypothetical protein
MRKTAIQRKIWELELQLEQECADVDHYLESYEELVKKALEADKRGDRELADDLHAQAKKAHDKYADHLGDPGYTSREIERLQQQLDEAW